MVVSPSSDDGTELDKLHDKIDAMGESIKMDKLHELSDVQRTVNYEIN